MNKKWVLISLLSIGIIVIVIGLIGLNNDRNQDSSGDRSQIITPNNTIGVGSDRSVRMLPIPPLLKDENEDQSIADFNLVVQQGETNFYNDVQTPTLGYNGSFLGPVIKVKRGETVNIHVENELSDSTSVHWHGLEVNGTEDGGPHQVIDQGTL